MTLIVSDTRRKGVVPDKVKEIEEKLKEMKEERDADEESAESEAIETLADSVDDLTDAVRKSTMVTKEKDVFDKNLGETISVSIEKSLGKISEQLTSISRKQPTDMSGVKILAENLGKQNEILHTLVDKLNIESGGKNDDSAQTEAVNQAMLAMTSALNNNNILLKALTEKKEPKRDNNSKWTFNIERDRNTGNIIRVDATQIM